MTEQRYDVYEVVILPPLRGCCSHHAFSRGSVLRTPPPACTLSTPSGFVQHQTKIKQIKDEVKILTKGGILMVSSFDYPYNFLKESTVNNCISIQPDFRNLSLYSLFFYKFAPQPNEETGSAEEQPANAKASSASSAPTSSPNEVTQRISLNL